MTAKLSVTDLDVRGKRVFVRVDFNVPLTKEGAVADATRIEAALPTINHLVGQGARVVLASHLGRPKGKRVLELTLKPVAADLGARLGTSVTFVPETIGNAAIAQTAQLGDGDVALLENVRFFPEEEANDPGFAGELARHAELYVNDAFGTAHRAHASTEGVTRHFAKCAAGFLMEKELSFLGRLIQNPDKPFAAVMGGAKISGKIDAMKNLFDKVDFLLVGGGMCFTFLRAQGFAIGGSIVEEDKVPLAKEILDTVEGKLRFLLPTDFVVSESVTEPKSVRNVPANSLPENACGVDIGEQTLGEFGQALSGCRTIFWNGPMGIFEVPEFAVGTVGIAKLLAERTTEGATTVVGGGDSVAAVMQANLGDKISHISTGGGASLEFVEGRELPGVVSLTDKER
jgi:phosphoglycerate kinase